MLPPPLFSLNVFPAELMFQKAPTPFETNYNGRPSFSFFFCPLSLSLSLLEDGGWFRVKCFPVWGLRPPPHQHHKARKGVYVKCYKQFDPLEIDSRS